MSESWRVRGASSRGPACAAKKSIESDPKLRLPLRLDERLMLARRILAASILFGRGASGHGIGALPPTKLVPGEDPPAPNCCRSGGGHVGVSASGENGPAPLLGERPNVWLPALTRGEAPLQLGDLPKCTTSRRGGRASRATGE